jgi:hypothetical protein
MDDLNKTERYEKNTALNIAFYDGRHEIVRMLLEHGDLMMKRTPDGITPFSQAEDEQTKKTFAQYQRLLPRFSGDLFECIYLLKSLSRIMEHFRSIIF